MPFLNQGQTHYIGINNEINIINYLKNNPDNNITQELVREKNSPIISYKHEGGTKQKKDASVIFENGEEIGISIKNHKQGTFDWENTTKGVPESLKNEIKNFQNENIDTPITKELRKNLENIFSGYLDNLSSIQIMNLLSKVWETEKETNKIIINDKKTNSIIMLDKSNLDNYFNPIHEHNFILKSTPRAKTSRQVWIKCSDGTEINTNIRIRLLLNNGITALLGRSNANKNACPCLKIQQDRVDDFIQKCENKVSVDY